MEARDRVMTLVRPRMVNRIVVAVLLGILLATATARAQEEAVYYHTDAIGSVRMITSETGGLIGRYDYLPFGELLPTQPPPPVDPRQFAGKERDAETGFDYFGARYYRAQSGRFTTVDPVMNFEAALTDPQRWNRYTNALHRPLVMTDPDGREAGYIYLPNGQMAAPIKAITPTMGKLWAGTVAAAAVVAGGPTVWRAAVGCSLSPSCQSGAINVLESAAGGTPTRLNPGRLLPALTSTTREALLEAAVAVGRGGVSDAGRALQSHAARAGSWLTGLAHGGSGAANTAAARKVLAEILQSGDASFSTHKIWGNIMSVRLKDGRGAVWTADGQFITFLERYSAQ